MESIIEMKNIVKKYKGFELNVPEFNIPKGFSTAFIGENGAGKTTLLDIIAGINLDFKGEITYFGEYDSADKDEVRESIGYSASSNYFMAHWTSAQVKEVCTMLFKSFDGEKFDRLCKDMSLIDGKGKKSRQITALSDGNKMRLMLASIFARDTRVLMMDEPASPLDPVMRDKLCDMIREYIAENNERSVIFSTHNISDMENVTDYAVIISKGKIAEQGFVEDLKEKYICVKGEPEYTEKAEKFMYSFNKNSYGFEGIILSDNLNKLAGMDIKTETPTLHQISVAVMKANS